MTGRPHLLTHEVIVALGSARRVGATLSEAAAAHGIAYPTLMRWVRQGRAGEGDPLCAELAAELDRAAAQLRQVLWSRALKATEKDGRLALDAIKHLDDAPLRRAKLRLARAQAVVEHRRATGEHVDRQDVTIAQSTANAEALHARLAAAARAAAAAAPGDAGGADSGADRDAPPD